MMVRRPTGVAERRRPPPPGSGPVRLADQPGVGTLGSPAMHGHPFGTDDQRRREPPGGRPGQMAGAGAVDRRGIKVGGATLTRLCSCGRPEMSSSRAAAAIWPGPRRPLLRAGRDRRDPDCGMGTGDRAPPGRRL